MRTGPRRTLIRERIPTALSGHNKVRRKKEMGDGADVPDAIPRCLSEGYFAIQLDLATANRRARDLGGLTISDSIVSWVAEARMVEHVE